MFEETNSLIFCQNVTGKFKEDSILRTFGALAKPSVVAKGLNNLWRFVLSTTGTSNLFFLQRASYKFKNVARAACKKLVMIQTLNDELKLSLY